MAGPDRVSFFGSVRGGKMSFAVSAMPLAFAFDFGSDDFWVVVTTLFGAAGLRETKYQTPMATRKNKTSAPTPPRINASFAGLRPPGFGNGGSVVKVAVAGTGGGTFAV
ncbi:MAG: hypothetical protein QOD64_1751, partial [Verrucomicrobiota bacterium]